jgi:hypothetical protein
LRGGCGGACGEDFLQEGIKNKEITNNTGTKIFTVEPRPFLIAFLPQKSRILQPINR